MLELEAGGWIAFDSSICVLLAYGSVLSPDLSLWRSERHRPTRGRRPAPQDGSLTSRGRQALELGEIWAV